MNMKTFGAKTLKGTRFSIEILFRIIGGLLTLSVGILIVFFKILEAFHPDNIGYSSEEQYREYNPNASDREMYHEKMKGNIWG